VHHIAKFVGIDCESLHTRVVHTATHAEMVQRLIATHEHLYNIMQNGLARSHSLSLLAGSIRMVESLVMVKSFSWSKTIHEGEMAGDCHSKAWVSQP